MSSTEDVGVSKPQTNCTNTGVPVLAYGLYKVPCGDEGAKIISNAISAGYRHFDGARIYGNEATLGRALAECLGKTKTNDTDIDQNKFLDRSELFVASKVWNDDQRENTVRSSVLSSLEDLKLEYLDIVYIHWPVPGYFVRAYRELILLQREGKIKHLGISNFRIADYEELLSKIPSNEFVPPLMHQFEVSPFMYRPDILNYYKSKNILVAASKALHRTIGLDDQDGAAVQDIAKCHSVTPAQVLLRWSFQRGLIVLSKTSSSSRMKENRDLFKFSLSLEEMDRLDNLTTEESVREREDLESKRRTS